MRKSCCYKCFISGTVEEVFCIVEEVFCIVEEELGKVEEVFLKRLHVFEIREDECNGDIKKRFAFRCHCCQRYVKYLSPNESL